MITTLEETIARVKDVAEMNSREAEEIRRISESVTPSNKQYRVIIERCRESAEEYEQVAAWLEELKERREADRWIPVSERLPDKEGDYLVDRKERRLSIQHFFFGIADHRPYWSGECKVYAWRPLPKHYESEDSK